MTNNNPCFALVERAETTAKLSAVTKEAPQ
jgi:hypothetical protein